MEQKTLLKMPRRTHRVKVEELLEGNKIVQELFGNDRAYWLVGSGDNKVGIQVRKNAVGNWFIYNCTCRVHSLFPCDLGDKKCCYTTALKIKMGIRE